MKRPKDCVLILSLDGAQLYVGGECTERYRFRPGTVETVKTTEMEIEERRQSPGSERIEFVFRAGARRIEQFTVWLAGALLRAHRP